MVKCSGDRKASIFVLTSADLFPMIRVIRDPPGTDETKQHSCVYRDPELSYLPLLTSFQIKLNQDTEQLSKTNQKQSFLVSNWV